ncbi:hypothetical protein [Streptomyces boncukensis]|uniref:Uncharacterized protein n=1 Tax=Streptomyces boncukensis TaxID=2711219 RepID=A0A6G4WVY1_9ACTN|nr:hypothetical protein [Streptomyces boncukensis]NGO69163.1 hypothetical protein [Streptomyces boncukensis]
MSTHETTDQTIRRLSAEVDRLNALAHRLTERLAEAQDASEGWYRAERERTGGPGFDPLRPVGCLTESCFPTPAQRAAVRLLQSDAARGGEHRG